MEPYQLTRLAKQIVLGIFDGTWSLANQRRLVFSPKKYESSARNVLEHCRDGGANCLLSTTPVSCGEQDHIGDRGHPCSTLLLVIDPVVRTRGVQ